MLRLSDIAAKAGVSPSTVSVVLNDGHTAVRISEKTRQKVLRASEELGYRANHMARAIRTGNSRMLGFMGGDLRNENVGCMLAGAVEEAERADFTVHYLPLPHDEGDAHQMIRRSAELRLMGVMALHLPMPMLQELWAEAVRYDYPLVLLDSPAPFDDLPQVRAHDEEGVAAAIAHLAGLGHRRIGLISGRAQSSLTTVRETAFRETLARFGLEARQEWMASGDFRLIEPNLVAAQQLLILPAARRPTAIFCASDKMALAVVQTAHKMKLRVPDDLSVIGYGDLSFAQYASPRLTTVAQPFEEMGRAAVRYLLEKSLATAAPEGNSSQDEPHIVLPTRLVERESTGRVPR